MWPSLLLLAMAAAHAVDPPLAPTPERHDVRVDLQVEAALARLKLPTTAVHTTTLRWTPAIAAPQRARAEGRTLAWEFNRAELHIEERTEQGAVARSVARSKTALDPACSSVSAPTSAPWALTPLGQPIQPRGEMESQERESSAGITYAQDGDSTRIFIRLDPGESATAVEILDRPARARNRAQRRRRLTLDLSHGRVEWDETDAGTGLCVSPRTPPPARRPQPSTPIPLAPQGRTLTPKRPTATSTSKS
ncbi:MAG: hypothetical protein AB8H79_23850 [Myxococcota bacterium]